MNAKGLRGIDRLVVVEMETTEDLSRVAWSIGKPIVAFRDMVPLNSYGISESGKGFDFLACFDGETMYRAVPETRPNEEPKTEPKTEPLTTNGKG